MRAIAVLALMFLPTIGISPWPVQTGCSAQPDGGSVCTDADSDSVNVSGYWQDEIPADTSEPDYDDTSTYDDTYYPDPSDASDTDSTTDPNDPIGLSVGLATGGDTSSATPSLPTTITVTDLAQAKPNPAHIRMEPDGWALLNSPTNFWIETGAPEVQTTLFNTPVTVEFTPTKVQWDYGDGTPTTTSTTGASWTALGQQPNTATETSHTYTTGGTYTVRATIHYQAAIHINGTRIDVTGTIQQTATTAPITLYRFSTVLTPNP